MKLSGRLIWKFIPLILLTWQCVLFTNYLVDYTVKLLETDGLLISLDLAHYLVLAWEKALVVSLVPVKLNFPTGPGLLPSE